MGNEISPLLNAELIHQLEPEHNHPVLSDRMEIAMNSFMAIWLK
jgi:hypothetical protein